MYRHWMNPLRGKHLTLSDVGPDGYTVPLADAPSCVLTSSSLNWQGISEVLVKSSLTGEGIRLGCSPYVLNRDSTRGYYNPY